MIDQVKAGDAYKKVAEAVSMGAQVLIGGSYEGMLFTPTVLARTTPDMRVNSEEVFAPVISVTPYDEFDEALRIANDSDFGLQVGIFTQNINRVMRAFEEMNVGGVIVNDIPSFRVDHMPYGGVRGSGTGREGPRYAIEEMTEPRLLVINRDGGIG
jgi:acyl-CoA reductase-like NAD-dependent aldehyde dehydrogenase